MKILKYSPAQRPGNFVGYLKLEMTCVINGKPFPMEVDVSIMRNSKTGHMFVNWPSKPFQTPEGKTAYAPLIKWSKEQSAEIQNEVIREFQKYVDNKNQIAQQQPPVQQQFFNPPDYNYAPQGNLPF